MDDFSADDVDKSQFDVIDQFGDTLFLKIKKNGMHVVLSFYPPSTQRTVIARSVSVGSKHESPWFQGGAHGLEHQAFKGSANYSGKNGVWKVIGSRGGRMNAMTWKDGTHYYFDVPSAQVMDALRVEYDRLNAPIINQADVDSEKTVVRSEKEIGGNNVMSAIHNHLGAIMYTDHPYARTTIGNTGTIEHMTADGYKEFMAEQYLPERMQISVVGYIADPKRVLAFIHDKFGSFRAYETIYERPSTTPLNAGKPRNLIPVSVSNDVMGQTVTEQMDGFREIHIEEPPQEGTRRSQLHRVAEDFYLVVAHKGPRANHPDAAALKHLSALLTDSTFSVLHQLLVKSGLVTSIDSGFNGGTDAGEHLIIAKIPSLSVLEHGNRKEAQDATSSISMSGGGTDRIGPWDEEHVNRFGKDVLERAKQARASACKTRTIVPYLRFIEYLICDITLGALRCPNRWKTIIPKTDRDFMETISKPVRIAQEALIQDPPSLSESMGMAFVDGDATRPFLFAVNAERLKIEDFHRVAKKYLGPLNRTIVVVIPDNVADQLVEIKTGPEENRVFKNFPETKDHVARARQEENRRADEARAKRRAAAAERAQRRGASDPDSVDIQDELPISLLPLEDPRKTMRDVITSTREVIARHGQSELNVMTNIPVLFSRGRESHTMKAVIAIFGAGTHPEHKAGRDTAPPAELRRRFYTALFTATMLTRGAGDRNAEQIEAEQAALSVYTSFGIGETAMTAVVSGNPDHLKEGLALLVDQLTHPTWPEDDFERIKKNMINSIYPTVRDPASRVENHMINAMFPPESFAAVSATNMKLDTVAAGQITLQDCKDFFHAHVLPTRAVMTISASEELEDDFIDALRTSVIDPWRRARTIDMVKDWAARDKTPEIEVSNFVLERVDPVPKHFNEAHFEPDYLDYFKPNAIVGFSRRTGIASDAFGRDAQTAGLAIKIAGGFTGRLNQWIRDTQGLSYTVRCGLSESSSFRGEIYWKATSTCNPNAAPKGLLAMKEALAWVSYWGPEPAENTPGSSTAWLSNNPSDLEQKVAVYFLHLVKQQHFIVQGSGSGFFITPDIEVEVLYENAAVLDRVVMLETGPGGDMLDYLKREMRRYSENFAFEIQNMIYRFRSELGMIKYSLAEDMRDALSSVNSLPSVLYGATTTTLMSSQPENAPESMFRRKLGLIQSITEQEVREMCARLFDIHGFYQGRGAHTEYYSTVTVSLPSSGVSPFDDYDRDDKKFMAAVRTAADYVPTKAKVMANLETYRTNRRYDFTEPAPAFEFPQ